MSKELIATIKKKIDNLITLEIVTMVGNIKADPHDATRPVPDLDPAATPPPRVILTRLNLLDGDITTVLHEDYVTGEYQGLREFHAQREAQAMDIVRQNVAALKELFTLAKTLVEDQTPAP